MMAVHFGTVHGETVEDVWNMFWEDCLAFEWDSPAKVMIGNVETGSAVIFDHSDVHDLDRLVVSAKQFFHEINFVMVYSEGWMVAAPKNTGADEAAKQMGRPSEHPDRKETKMGLCLSKDYNVSRMFIRDEEEWLEDKEIFNPLTNVGRTCISIRKEMDW